MNHKTHFLTAIAIAAGALLSGATGCELIASVDRSKIAGTGGATGGAGGTGGTGTGGSTGGSGGSTTSSNPGGGGTGGSMPMCTGGAMACGMDSDCPATGNECVLPKCTGGCCTTANTPDGTETTAGQNAGDCKVQVCDGNGATKIVNDDDPQDDGNDCTQDTCNNGANVHAEIAGSCDDDGGKVCGNPAGPKKGVCVECNVDADCTTLGDVCDPVNGTNTCVPSSCADGVKNGSETGLDCGGPACGDCPNGQGCSGAGDCQSGFCNGTLCAACTMDANCAAGEYCGTATVGTPGVCAADQANGQTCSTGAQCASGNCIDGFCCDMACNGTCEACSAAVKGQGVDGACGPIAVATDPENECTDQGAASCGNNGSCDGAGACQKYAAGTLCRASAGACDQSETCAGGGAACPADTFQPNTTVCRSSTGVCDAAENCTGTSATCPADAFLPNTTVCRAATGVCDAAETCTGTTAACPADAFLPNTTVCRASAGVCDAAETCTGTTATCPADAFAPNTTVCRASAGVCDAAETCTGSAATCPADAFQPNTTVCRASAGVCDVAETCTGSAAACPADAFQPNTTVCRASAGVCDVAESCTGATASCPANGFQPAGTAPAALQSPGDCQKIVCNGTNATSVSPADDVTDIPVSNSACLINPACDTSGGPATPAFTPAPTGTACNDSGGKVCGNTSNPLIAGTCVECNTDADCLAVNDAGTLVCNTSTHTCE